MAALAAFSVLLSAIHPPRSARVIRQSQPSLNLNKVHAGLHDNMLSFILAGVVGSGLAGPGGTRVVATFAAVGVVGTHTPC